MSHDFTDIFFIKNGKFVETSTKISSSDKNISVYDVVRIISGKALFIDDHIERLNKSIQLTGINFTISDTEKIKRQIEELCSKNQKFFGNIEIRLTQLSTEEIEFIIGFISHKYPSPLDYINGVKVSLLYCERKNPNAKVKNTEVREKANKIIKQKGVYEILLVNEFHQLTEGSRSNVFFIKNNTLVTAPLQYVLPGITRKYVIEIIKNTGLQLIEKLILIEELSTFDAVFICGTSPGVLPVAQIDNNTFDVNNAVLRKIIFEFNNIVSKNMS